MPADDIKRARQTLTREMKGITDIATARSRALGAAIKQLQKQGTKGIPKVLSTHGKHFTPEEKALLENATEEDLQKLIENHTLLKRLRSTMECI